MFIFHDMVRTVSFVFASTSQTPSETQDSVKSLKAMKDVLANLPQFQELKAKVCIRRRGVIGLVLADELICQGVVLELAFIYLFIGYDV